MYLCIYVYVDVYLFSVQQVRIWHLPCFLIVYAFCLIAGIRVGHAVYLFQLGHAFADMMVHLMHMRWYEITVHHAYICIVLVKVKINVRHT
jgi:hypothetical protein